MGCGYSKGANLTGLGPQVWGRGRSGFAASAQHGARDVVAFTAGVEVVHRNGGRQGVERPSGERCSERLPAESEEAAAAERVACDGVVEAR